MKKTAFILLCLLLSFILWSSGGLAALYINEFTQHNGTTTFIDTFSDGIEPPSGPLSSSDYIVYGSYSANRENGGRLQLDISDAVVQDSDKELVTAVGDSNYTFGPGSGGYVSAVFEIYNGLSVNSYFGIGISNYQLITNPIVTSESTGVGIVVGPTGSIYACWSHNYYDDAGYLKDITADFGSITSITMVLEIDTGNNITAKWDYGSDGIFDLVIDDFYNLNFDPSHYTGDFTVIEEEASELVAGYQQGYQAGYSAGLSAGGECATFNIVNDTLHVPCLDLGAKYWLDLTLKSSAPVMLELTGCGENN